MLKADEVQFSIVPVFSNRHISAELSKLTSPDEGRFLRSLLFINCGGGIDLSSKPIFQARPHVQFYVMDSHRPVHHKNIHEESGRIIVLQDEHCTSFQECPTKEDEIILQELKGVESSEEEEYDSELDEANEELADLQDEDEKADDAVDLGEEREADADELDSQPQIGEKRQA